MNFHDNSRKKKSQKNYVSFFIIFSTFCIFHHLNLNAFEKKNVCPPLENFLPAPLILAKTYGKPIFIPLIKKIQPVCHFYIHKLSRYLTSYISMTINAALITQTPKFSRIIKSKSTKLSEQSTVRGDMIIS